MKSFLRLFLRLCLLSLFVFSAACRKNNEDPINPDLYGDGTGLGPIDEIPAGEWDTEFDPLAERGSFETMSPVDTSAYAPVYFAFDSYTVAPGEVGKIQAIASALLSNPAQGVVLQGHTDERGSREYNLALGERRALAVRELLLTMGLTSDRVQTLSMGEESPAVAGFDESAWSLNRRVQFQLMQ